MSTYNSVTLKKGAGRSS